MFTVGGCRSGRLLKCWTGGGGGGGGSAARLPLVSAPSTTAATTSRADPATPIQMRFCPPTKSRHHPRDVLLGRHVCGGQAAVDDEGRPVDVRRLVRGEEERGVDDLPGRGQATCGPVH